MVGHRSLARVALALVLSTCAVTALIVASDQSPILVHDHHDAQQGDPDASCGPVSLAVVAEYLDRPATIRELNDATRAGELGACSFADLLRALRERGFAAEALRYDSGRPPSHRLPMVLFVDGHHFFAALPGRAGRVVIVDPPREPVDTDWADLTNRWQGEAILVALDETTLRRAIALDADAE